MHVIISSKSKDFNVWRPAGEFADRCRYTLLNRTENLLSDQAEALFAAADCELDDRIAAHEASLTRLRKIIDQAGQAATPRDLKLLVTDFYSCAYDFFSQNRSAIAFYRLSETFLRTVCAMIVGYAKNELGIGVDRLPSMTLIILGSGGRQEFSPFSRLPLLLVYDETDSFGAVPLRLFGKILHEAFEDAGLLPDDVITPRNPAWNNDLTQWRHGLPQKVEQGTEKELIDIIRLGSQVIIYDEGPGAEFREHCLSFLKSSHSALNLMVKRLMELPRGIGIMGGLKYEKRGACQGYFNLSSHTLLPLTAAVDALALLKGVTETGTSERIRALLKRGVLNVEMSERLLESWHLFNEMRLEQETAMQPEWGKQNVLCIDTENWGIETFEHFKECLETVSTLHRQVGIAFSACLELA